MDWEPKMPPWDLAEFGRDGEPSQGRQTNPMGCSVDLKLGGSGDSELFNRWKERPGDSTAAMAFPASSSATTASALASSKKPRSLGGGAVCLVDGCPADLSICREYHRRHKVCEVHSKAPVVLVKGQEQRFCQQCSRFHLLVEFDEVKRSCRKRLDGHNRRRRKPQPDPINDPRFFSQQQYHHQGIRFLSPIFPGGAAVPEQKWSPAAMNEEGNAHAAIFVHKHDGALFSSFSRGYYREAAAAAAAEVGIHPLIGAIAATSESKIFSGGFAGGPASDCALSLLSSPVGNPSISDPSGATVVAAAEERTPMGNPLLGASLQQYGLSLFSRSSQGSGHVSPGGLSCASGMEEVEQNGGAAVDVAGGSFHGQGFFHLGVDGAADRAPRGLPFSW